MGFVFCLRSFNAHWSLLIDLTFHATCVVTSKLKGQTDITYKGLQSLKWMSKAINASEKISFMFKLFLLLCIMLAHILFSSFFIVFFVFKALKRQMWLKYTIWIGWRALWRFCRCVSVHMFWWWWKWIWDESKLCSWHVSFLFHSPDKTLAICRHDCRKQVASKKTPTWRRVHKMRQNF